MKREFKVEANVGAPQVAYRERSPRRSTSTTPTRSRPAVRASSPRQDQPFEPGERGSGFVFETKIVGGNVPKEYIPGVEKGLEETVMELRPLASASRSSTSRSR
jgi:elongation factor G